MSGWFWVADLVAGACRDPVFTNDIRESTEWGSDGLAKVAG